MRKMMSWFAGLSFVAALQAVSLGASAQQASADTATGRFLTREVCSRVVAADEARCHSHVRGRQQW